MKVEKVVEAELEVEKSQTHSSQVSTISCDINDKEIDAAENDSKPCFMAYISVKGNSSLPCDTSNKTGELETETVSLNFHRDAKIVNINDILEEHLTEATDISCNKQSGFTVHERGRDFNCAFCQKGFSEKAGRDDHERIHTGEKPYKCDFCDKSFRAKAMLYTHKKFHFKTAESYHFPCMHCPKKFQFHSALALHLRKHTGERQYNCILCSKGFYRKCDLAKHIMLIHPTATSDMNIDKTDPLESENGDVKMDHKTATDGIQTVLKVDVFGKNCSDYGGQNKKVNAIVTKYECEECGKVFYKKRTLEVHSRIHTGECPHTCQICGLQFRQIGALHRHLRTVHEGRKDYSCHICGKCFGEKVSRDDHVRIHTGERPYPCNLCDKYFKSRAALNIHKKSHSTFLPHECVVCGKCFRFPGLLVGHMKIHTGEEKEKLHQCKECEKSFPTKSELKSHESIHTNEKSFTCEQCGKEFRFSSTLHRHVKIIHEGRKDFSCYICGGQFAQKAARDNHVRVHTWERPFSCDICGKNFKTKTSVYIHKKFHTKSFTLPCPSCQKCFYTQSSLSVHLRTHTGEKPYPCDVCDKRFATNRDMRNHRVIHSEDKPYECALCGMKFRLKRYLIKHMFKGHNTEKIG
ncbi:hypothetical protein ANN_23770 [Periplaneta americana]|uniref:C2H2-type domain-containing protein n=1 Tax=Periplaneta americana TaxID=6978 RepID=A0ABQ8SLZ7_PERAM|nr:hypothetical protein ANN_23770 [Periplaneta americana]